jgi:hypothetical protein
LKVLAAIEGHLSQHLAGGDHALTATAVPTDFDYLGHFVLLR